ncbi:polysaccharide pyruvyl transferase family protein [Rothia sp. P4278]|uniref:polysaccharide pyruvyl transferase family protein n=1 Tax=Rothia sp. P4278 TaxID=3402658 RepID=UPI003ADD735F
MKILVLWANEHHDNLGVAALGVGTRSLALRAFGEGTEVKFHGTGDSSLPHNDGPINISRVKSLLLNALKPGSEFKSWIKGFDLIIDARGGDSFSDIYGIKRQIKTSALGWVARLMGIPVVLGPQTVGPFNSITGKLSAFLTLQLSSLTMARDPYSMKYAQKFLTKSSLLTTDVVFALESARLEKKYDVLLNVSGLLWNENPHVDYQKYRTMIHETIQGLIEQERSVTLLPHVLSDNPKQPEDHDLYPIPEILATYPGLRVAIPQSLSQARQIIGQANLVIAARMHACLNALSMSTPTIPMAYSRKFAPLLEQVNWAHTVDIRDINSSAKDVLTLAEQNSVLEQESLRVRQEADVLVSKAVQALKKFKK